MPRRKPSYCPDEHNILFHPAAATNPLFLAGSCDSSPVVFVPAIGRDEVPWRDSGASDVVLRRPHRLSAWRRRVPSHGSRGRIRTRRLCVRSARNHLVVGAAWLASVSCARSWCGSPAARVETGSGPVAAVIDLSASFASSARCLDLPVKGSVATPALWSHHRPGAAKLLGDVFSGIASISSALTAWATGVILATPSRVGSSRPIGGQPTFCREKSGCGDHPEQRHCENPSGSIALATKHSRAASASTSTLADARRGLTIYGREGCSAAPTSCVRRAPKGTSRTWKRQR